MARKVDGSGGGVRLSNSQVFTFSSFEVNMGFSLVAMLGELQSPITPPCRPSRQSTTSHPFEYFHLANSKMSLLLQQDVTWQSLVNL